MATLEQFPSRSETVSNPLDSVLSRVYTINWELAFYAVVLVIALLTRFVGLGDRVMSHDESLHTKYSHDLYERGIFAHTPLMHGPVLFHMTALSYFLFGDNDFTARIYPAVLGVIMVFMPKLMFGRWLGKYGAMAATVLILISPMLLFHHRYIREDTPALFFTLLMVYAIFAYIDGTRPRALRWLVLLSAATLLNLASKETAFMYIGVFGIMLVMLLAFQMIQGWRTGRLGMASVWAVLGTILVPTITGVLAAFIMSRDVGGESLVDRINNPATAGFASIPNTLLALAIVVGLTLLASALVFFVLLVIVALISRTPITGLFGSLVTTIAERGKSLFVLCLAGITLGIVASLAMTVVLSIIPPEQVWRVQQVGDAAAGVTETIVDQGLLGRLILWTSIVVIIMAAVLFGTVLRRFRRMPRLPWVDITIVALVAFISCSVLVVLEERSRRVPNVSSEVRTVNPGEFHDEWIYGAWAVGLASVVGILLLKYRTNFFEEMRQYPAFDLVILLGALVLPWTSAIPVFLAGYPLDSNNFGGQTQMISASIFATIPFILVSLAAGLSWNPTRFLVCAATFYGIFVFFFTTIFTNIYGVGTGLVQSLGYWLAQQGVRRGSQPQYYYLGLQVPLYEYLPTIGAFLAGIVGMLGMWRFRAERIAAREQYERAIRDLPAAYYGEPVQTSKPDSFTYYGERGVDPSASEAASYDPHSAETQFGMANTTQEMDTLSDSDFDTANSDNAVGNTVESLQRQRASADNEFYEPNDTGALLPRGELVTTFPFVAFVGIWAGLITMALTMAGEKMPWLTTHIALPLTLLAGWYLGHLMEKIDWAAFWRTGWGVVALVPIFLVGASAVVGTIVIEGQVFAGLERGNLMQTFTWLGALLIAGFAGYLLVRIARQITREQAVTIGVLGVFVLLGILTARHAWMAAYINYDHATEFLVYAHGAPANKTVVNYLEEMSRRSAEGRTLNIAYNDEVSWPGSWYFRDFPNARFVGGLDNPESANLTQYDALVVGDEDGPRIEPLLSDAYYKFDYVRLWWPMQEYFDLNATRIDNALGDSGYRRALWDIWWNRDYTTYDQANDEPSKNFTLGRWYVADRMHFFVRKDLAAQIWDLGVGAASVGSFSNDPFANLRCDTCAASTVFDTRATALNSPRGITVGPDKNVYVVDNQNSRIVVYDPQGNFVRAFGVAGAETPGMGEGAPPVPAPMGAFWQPWGIAVDKEGTIYIADTWNHRVQILSNDGTPIRTWGQLERIPPGSTVESVPDGFFGPRDIEVDANGLIYVADTGNHRVRVYDINGTLIRDIGTYGTQPGQLKEPVGLAISDAGELYVASTWSKTISVFKIDDGRFSRQWNVSAWNQTTETTDTGNRPYIALDNTQSRLLITDHDAGRIMVYDINGMPQVVFGRIANDKVYTFTAFGVLGGIATDPDTGTIYLSDAGANRILRFEPQSIPGLSRPDLRPRSEETDIAPTDAVETEAAPESESF